MRIFFLIIVSVFGVSLVNYRSEAPLRFSAEGYITEINWESKNHGATHIVVNQRGASLHFYTTEILLHKGDIEVGHYFVKKAGSKDCLINGSKYQCLK